MSTKCFSKRAGAIVIALAMSVLSSCTYTRIPPKLYASRTNDTMSVSIDPFTHAQWEPARDSIILDCPTCAYGKSNIVEHLEERSYADFGIPITQTVNVSMYRRGVLDTSFVMAGVGNTDSSAAFVRMRRRRAYDNTADNAPAIHKKVVAVEPPVKAPADIVTKKKISTIHVIAAEGVAVYKDKSKTEVLKILPTGSTLTILAREGDLYSVALGDGEGFVEAEAVQIDP